MTYCTYCTQFNVLTLKIWVKQQISCGVPAIILLDLYFMFALSYYLLSKAKPAGFVQLPDSADYLLMTKSPV